MDKLNSEKKLEQHRILAVACLLILRFGTYQFEWYRESIKRLLRLHRRAFGKGLKTKQLGREENQEIYEKALGIAALELSRRYSAFPAKCPFTLDKILSPDFYPEPTALPFQPWQAISGAQIQQDWSESGFHLTRLPPSLTGLPVMLWALEKWVSNRQCAVLVADRSPGKKGYHLAEAYLASANRAPKLLFGGSLIPKHWKATRQYLQANHAVFRAHWQGDLDSFGLIESLQNNRARKKAR